MMIMNFQIDFQGIVGYFIVRVFTKKTRNNKRYPHDSWNRGVSMPRIRRYSVIRPMLACIRANIWPIMIPANFTIIITRNGECS